MMHYTEIRLATLQQLNDELAGTGRDSTLTDIHEAREAVARLANQTQRLMLHDYRSGAMIGRATDDEAAESINAGAEGVIMVDGQSCYVW